VSPSNRTASALPSTATCRGSGSLQDHYIARISYPVSGLATVNERSRGVALAFEVLRYLVIGKGTLSYSASLAAPRSRCSRNRRPPMCSAASPQAASGTGRSAPPDGRPCGGRRFPRHHRRGVADATAVARLCRGVIAEPCPGAGDQPALSVGPDRPARDDRWAPLRPPPLRRTGARPLLRRRDPAGCGSCRDDELLDYARQKDTTVYHATRT
jgi:hypothetical protein